MYSYVFLVYNSNVIVLKSSLEKEKVCVLGGSLVNKSSLGFISSLGSMPLHLHAQRWHKGIVSFSSLEVHCADMHRHACSFFPNDHIKTDEFCVVLSVTMLLWCILIWAFLSFVLFLDDTGLLNVYKTKMINL